MSVLSERWVGTEGRRLRYLIGGQGKPLVLCHGFLSSAEEFGGRFQALARHRTLIVPDLPGSAASDPLQARHTSETLADAVDRLLSELGVDELDLGGLCLGGSVACALARLRGEAVGRLVLHTPLLTPGLMRARYRHQVNVLTRPVFWQGVTWLSRRRTVSDLYKRFVIREGPIDRQTADINYANQRRVVPQAAREWIRDGIKRNDLDLIMGRKEPTLIIIARNDGLVNVHGLERAIERLPNVQIYIDEESGHGWSEAAVIRHLDVLDRFFGDPDGSRVLPPVPAG